MKPIHLWGAALALALCCTASHADDWQRAPLSDLKAHGFVVVNAGLLSFKPYGSASEPWTGPDLALGAGYNAGPLTAVGIFDHGFPVGSSQGHRNVARGYLNLKLYPQGPGGAWQAFAGAGVLSVGAVSLRDWSGGEAHLAATRTLSPRMAVGGYYGHGFALTAGREDLDFYRLYLTGRIFP